MAKLCATKAMLLRAYQGTTIAQSDVVLARSLAARSDESESLFQAAQQADEKATAAKNELRKHVAEHGC